LIDRFLLKHRAPWLNARVRFLFEDAGCLREEECKILFDNCPAQVYDTHIYNISNF